MTPSARRRIHSSFATFITLFGAGAALTLFFAISGNYLVALSQAGTPAATPSPAGAALQAGMDALKNWDLDNALAHFNDTIQLDASDAAAYTGRCEVYWHRTQYDLAYSDCSKAIGLNPQDAEAYAVRSLIQLAQGTTTAALTDANMALQ